MSDIADILKYLDMPKEVDLPEDMSLLQEYDWGVARIRRYKKYVTHFRKEGRRDNAILEHLCEQGEGDLERYLADQYTQGSRWSFYIGVGFTVASTLDLFLADALYGGSPAWVNVSAFFIAGLLGVDAAIQSKKAKIHSREAVALSR